MKNGSQEHNKAAGAFAATQQPINKRSEPAVNRYVPSPINTQSVGYAQDGTQDGGDPPTSSPGWYSPLRSTGNFKVELVSRAKGGGGRLDFKQHVQKIQNQELMQK